MAVLGGHRSYQRQKQLFAAERSASTTKAPWTYADWATTKVGRWLAANAWRHGFVRSYPKGAGKKTCYAYEPWHYRYVGRTLASKVRASGLTLREYLWRYRETVP